MFIPKKEFQQLKAEIAELSNLIKGEEFQKLKNDSKKLKELQELISHVKFKIKNISYFENQETNQKSIIVTYELPKVVLDLDENGNPNKNDFFYASNMLNMISFDDMMKFQDFLKKCKK